MAQNITLMGASYTDVPGVQLPKTGGGTALFSDASITTATASDVASGKLFIASNGAITTGTNSGGGGGASNLICGEFTTIRTASSITLPYTGTGYPVAAMAYIKGGMYNNTSSGDTAWYNLVQRYAIGYWTMQKRRPDVAPTYTTSGEENMAVAAIIYKSSSSTATSYSRTSGLDANIFSSANADTGAFICIRFTAKNVLSFYANMSSYCLPVGHTFTFMVMYSE